MTGKLKVLSLSKEIEGLKAKKNYADVNIHFRNLHHHTMTLKNKKEYVLEITATSIDQHEELFLSFAKWGQRFIPGQNPNAEKPKRPE